MTTPPPQSHSASPPPSHPASPLESSKRLEAILLEEMGEKDLGDTGYVLIQELTKALLQLGDGKLVRDLHSYLFPLPLILTFPFSLSTA